MNTEYMKELISKIYNEGLFYNETEKSKEMKELEEMTEYPDIDSLFYSDVGPSYIFNIAMLHEECKKIKWNRDKYIELIDSVTYHMGETSEYKLNYYYDLLGKLFNKYSGDIAEEMYELMLQGYTADQIYDQMIEQMKSIKR